MSANASGAPLWRQRYTGPHFVAELAPTAVVSPDGSRVSPAGAVSDCGPAGTAYAVIAYSAATGRQLWVGRFRSGGGAWSVAVSPDGSTVYVAGSTSPAVTAPATTQPIT